MSDENTKLDLRNALGDDPSSFGPISTFLAYLATLVGGLAMMPPIVAVIIFLIENDTEFEDYFWTLLVIPLPALLSLFFVWYSLRYFLVKLHILSPSESHHSLRFSSSDSNKDLSSLSGLTEILISFVSNSKSIYSFWEESSVSPLSVFTFATFTVIYREKQAFIGRFLLSPDKSSNSFVFYSRRSSCLEALQDALKEIDVTTELIAPTFTV